MSWRHLLLIASGLVFGCFVFMCALVASVSNLAQIRGL